MSLILLNLDNLAENTVKMHYYMFLRVVFRKLESSFL